MFQSSVNFNCIKEKLQEVDFTAGTFIFQTNRKTSWKDGIAVGFRILGYGLCLIFAYGTIIQHQLILYILEVMFKLVCCCIYVTIGVLYYKKDTVHKLIDWCDEMYCPKNYPIMFGNSTYHVARKHIMKVHKRTKFMLKWMPVLMQADTAIATVGVGIVYLMLPKILMKENEYKVPVPYYLPFEEQETLVHFVITFLLQFLCGASLMCAVSLVVAIFLCIVFHVIAYLDFVNELVRLIGEELKASKKSDLELRNCLNIITSMINQITENFSILSELYTFFFLLLECSAFGSLIIFGLTFLVLHQQYAIAMSIIIVAFALYTICYIGEKINDNFSNIANNIYDMPWYELSPKQRKIVLQAMLCGNIDLQFKAAGIHYVTSERFLGIVNAAYSNCIVLKNLILK